MLFKHPTNILPTLYQMQVEQFDISENISSIVKHTL